MTFEDRLNPFALKEMRQMTRNKSIIASIFLYLAVEVILSVFVLINSETGDYLFGLITMCFAVASIIVIPSNVYVRTLKEKEDGLDCVLFSTGLKSSNVIDGKNFAGITTQTVFLACSAPFMVAAYYFGGIDLKCTFLLLVVIYMIGSVNVLVATMVAILRIHKVLKHIGFGLVLWMSGVLVSPFFIGYDIDELIIGIIVMFEAALAVAFAVRANSIAILTHSHSNNFHAWRITNLLIYAAVVLNCILNRCLHYDESRTVKDLFIVVLMSIPLYLMFVSVSSLPGFSRRVLAERPKSRAKRVVGFFFATGAQSGIVYSLVFFALSTCIVYVIGVKSDFFALCSMCYYVVFFMLMARIVISFIGKTKIFQFTGVIAVVLVLLIQFLLSDAHFYNNSNFIPFVFGSIGSDKYKMWHFYVAIISCLCALAVLSPSIFKAFRNYVFRDSSK